MDKKIINNLKKKIYLVFKSFDAYLVHSCSEYKNFSGRDIDAFYEKNYFFDVTYKKDLIARIKNNNYRIYINYPKKLSFLNLDVEKLSSLPKKIKFFFEKKFNIKFFCKKTNLQHLDEKSIIFYKLFKYFYGTIYSHNQLLDLKKKIQKLNKKDFSIILYFVDKAFEQKKEIIKNFLLWDFKKFINNRKVNKFFLELIAKRNKKREVFKGRLKLRNIIFSKKFIYAFILGPFAKWKRTHYSMPAIAIVGNDGSGKSTIIEHIRKNFSKMDPAIFDMKSSNPYFLSIDKMLKILKSIQNNKLVKSISYLSVLIAFIGEFLQLFDKYFKYKIGMAWADSGSGLTIFERYPTDRIRGEFPNKKNKFIPFEQFFPFPDGIVYLDVLPKDSISRKKEDNHSIDEMKSKRKNYISLLREFNEYKNIHYNYNLDKKIIKIKNYIFELYKIKNKQIKKNGKIKRVIWNKNFNRPLAGKELDRSQRGSFFRYFNK